VGLQYVAPEISLDVIFQVIGLFRANHLNRSVAALFLVLASDSAAPVNARFVYFSEITSEINKTCNTNSNVPPKL